jgi:hypothetical protein
MLYPLAVYWQPNIKFHKTRPVRTEGQMYRRHKLTRRLCNLGKGSHKWMLLSREVFQHSTDEWDDNYFSHSQHVMDKISWIENGVFKQCWTFPLSVNQCHSHMELLTVSAVLLLKLISSLLLHTRAHTHTHPHAHTIIWTQTLPIIYPGLNNSRASDRVAPDVL